MTQARCSSFNGLANGPAGDPVVNVPIGFDLTDSAQAIRRTQYKTSGQFQGSVFILLKVWYWPARY